MYSQNKFNLGVYRLSNIRPEPEDGVLSGQSLRHKLVLIALFHCQGLSPDKNIFDKKLRIIYMTLWI